ncbi:transposase [Streptomyces sp. NPDC059101]|uniref:transposase n=1 Tax=unclassified Streptomyces TaxID=2593676 RepID=UPI0036AE8F23
MSLGTVAWPVLRRAGYSREKGGGKILAAAGIGAILSPPTLGSAAFVIAEYLRESYLTILLYATIPTVLYYLGIILAIACSGHKTSKVHLLADDRARPLTWQTSPGQRGDSPMFIAVLEGLRIRRRGSGRPRSRPDRVRGDKAYSSYDNRAYLRRRGIKATIAQPEDQRANRRRKGRAGGRPPAFDKTQYRRRSAVERCVSKWKQHRAVASRYDKRDYIFNGTLAVAAIVIWLRDTGQEPSETA